MQELFHSKIIQENLKLEYICEQVPSSGKYKSYLKPLFMYKPIPTQRPKQTFRFIVGDASTKLIPEMWLREIKQLAK